MDLHGTRRKASDIAQVIGMMDYDAIGLGERDLAFGPDFLRSVQEEFNLPFVCANAKRNGEALFPPYRVVERDGVRVGFLGVVGPERHIVAQVESALLEHKIQIGDPTEAALQYLPELREKADVVVLLSHTGIEAAEYLAQDLPVDIVVVGHYPAVEPSPRRFDKTLFLMAGTKSDRFGTLEFTLNDADEITDFHGEAVRLLKDGPEDAEVAALAAQIEQRDKDERRERQLALQRDREVRQAADKTAKIQEHKGVMGSESCRNCHEDVYASWLETAHASAFATLAEQDAWDNPECLGCHTTRQTPKVPVADVNVPPEMWNVQCEECHGSGLDHARDGSYVTGGESMCRRCHDTKFRPEPEFDFRLYMSYGVH
jgi:hypothetical protein